MESPGPISTLPPDAPSDACPRCLRRLDDLPKGARFCPKCGGQLPLPAVPLEFAPTFRERMDQFQQILREHLGSATPAPSLEQVHSLMLLGYANAMHQLGWRYEHGNGVARNSEEAERCYTKSAKLGNVFAKARLADKAVDLPITDTPIPAQPIEPPAIDTPMADTPA